MTLVSSNNNFKRPLPLADRIYSEEEGRNTLCITDEETCSRSSIINVSDVNKNKKKLGLVRYVSNSDSFVWGGGSVSV